MQHYIYTELNACVLLIIYISHIHCLHSISKRYYQIPSYDSTKNAAQERSQQILDRFHINTNTIIRTQDSRALGAKYINETELPSNEDCLIWCWETSACNLAVYEEKTRGSCYLFDCGSNEDFRCKFTKHNFYSSSILQTNRHPYELSQWGSQVQHENELTRLRSMSSVGSVTPMPKSSTYASRSLVAPSLIPTTTVNSLLIKKPSVCKHYQFECRNNSECIAIYNVCDGIPQCADGSDEADDLECHKSRFNVPNGAQAQDVPEMARTGNKQNDMKANDLRPQSSITNYQHESKHTANKSLPPLQSYNYPKSADIENTRLSSSDSHQQIVPKKHEYNSPTERINKNTYNSQYGNAWNPYYQSSDAYNGGENRVANGYLVEPEYVNAYNGNRDTTAGQYWSSINRPQSYELSDQLLSANNQQSPQSNKLLPNGDEWQQTNDRYSGYYDRILKNANSPMAANRGDSLARPISQETASNSNFKSQQSVSQTKHDSDTQKYEQQLKWESKEKKGTNEGNEGNGSQAKTNGGSYASSLAANKRFVNAPNIVAVSYMNDSSQQSGRETNSAVIALSLGLFVTALLIVLVGCRMKSFKKKIARRGRTLAHDADYLVNGMYL